MVKLQQSRHLRQYPSLLFVLVPQLYVIPQISAVLGVVEQVKHQQSYREQTQLLYLLYLQHRHL
jgi:hypothetical protein